MDQYLFEKFKRFRNVPRAYFDPLSGFYVSYGEFVQDNQGDVGEAP
jgi:hypothetical protein